MRFPNYFSKVYLFFGARHQQRLSAIASVLFPLGLVLLRDGQGLCGESAQAEFQKLRVAQLYLVPPGPRPMPNARRYLIGARINIASTLQNMSKFNACYGRSHSSQHIVHVSQKDAIKLPPYIVRMLWGDIL